MAYQHLSCFSSCLTSLFLKSLHQSSGCKEFLFLFEYTVTLFKIKPISDCNEIYCFVFFITVENDAGFFSSLIFNNNFFGSSPADI